MILAEMLTLRVLKKIPASLFDDIMMYNDILVTARAPEVLWEAMYKFVMDTKYAKGTFHR